jgi:hypothetical protein
VVNSWPGGFQGEITVNNTINPGASTAFGFISTGNPATTSPTCSTG